MAQPERVDMLVLGSDEAGTYLAWYMAHDGHRTAVVERPWVGGACPNINCLPGKNKNREPNGGMNVASLQRYPESASAP
jgi:pyruvate/2-oxoglutarate dehydrogenase complex dihydrolipoamide dehydrogenase (E3) component